MSAKILVIFHSADYDGIFSREIAFRFFGQNAVYHGWDYKDAKLEFPDWAEQVYIIDLSPDCLQGFENSGPARSDKIVWIDHHKSAIEKYNTSLKGYRIDGVAACRLAWQWFFSEQGPMNPNLQEPDYHLPSREDFIDRRVSEPLSVRLAGEYDVWDHRDGEADINFQFGLDSQAIIPWSSILTPEKTSEEITWRIVQNGTYARNCYAKRDADVMRERSFNAEFEGLKFLCLNTPRCNSGTFKEKDYPMNGHDALLAFYFDGRNWNVSMYHAAHNREVDLSQIAAKFGGGGHKGACGFRIMKLPFLP